MQAAGGGVHGIDRACIAADENASAHDGGLADHRFRVRNPEGPLQLQAGDLVGGQSRILGRLKACVLDIDTPAVPRGSGAWITERRIIRTLLRKCRADCCQQQNERLHGRRPPRVGFPTSVPRPPTARRGAAEVYYGKSRLFTRRTKYAVFQRTSFPSDSRAYEC